MRLCPATEQDSEQTTESQQEAMVLVSATATHNQQLELSAEFYVDELTHKEPYPESIAAPMSVEPTAEEMTNLHIKVSQQPEDILTNFEEN